MNISRATATARGVLLDWLMDGLVPRSAAIELAGMEHGLTAQHMDAAARFYCVTVEEKDGQTYWRRPDNLFPIWWGREQKAKRLTGGSAA